jgi:2-dehydro-3-deoxyphosphooctonate aldolase (KDO 8-P synthase)
MKLCGFDVGLDQPFFLIAGNCVVESRQMAFDTAGALKEITTELGIPFIFKASFDKANRSSGKSYRGPGREQGLEILAAVKRELGVPVLTDVHTIEDIEVAESRRCAADPGLPVPPDRLHRACAQSGKPVNIKKGQFLARTT